MIRHYFLADSLNTTEQVAELLQQQQLVKDSDFHVLSRDNRGLKQHHLHPANLLQRSDLVRGAQWGAAAGFVFSLAAFCCAVLIMAFWSETSAMIKNTIFIASVIVPVILGTGVGAAIGVTREHHKISRFHQQLENGSHLLMINSEEDQLAIIEHALAAFPVINAGSDRLMMSPFSDAEETSPFARAA
ncbi:MAG: hypothetical protein V7752_00570 [Halopseudomonas sp.]